MRKELGMKRKELGEWREKKRKEGVERRDRRERERREKEALELERKRGVVGVEALV